MDGSSSTSAEKSDKFREFANYAKCWTLKQDKELKDALQSTVSGMLDTIRHFETAANALESEMELFECRFENIHNRIGCLKMERLVKEQVDEIPVDLLRGRPKKANRENLTKEVSQEEYEQRTISTISNAIRRGFDLFDIRQDQQCGSFASANSQNNSDPSDPSSSAELPKNEREKSANIWEGMEILRSFEHSEMPPIIGTDEFYEAIRRTNETKTDTPKAKEGSGPSLPARLTTTTTAITKNEEEDIASISSGRSAPPQDPVVIVAAEQLPRKDGVAEERSGRSGSDTVTMRTALMEEITQRSRKKEENRDNTEKEGEKREIGQQKQRVEEKQRIGERRQAEEDEEEQQQKQRNARVTEMQRQLVTERVERKQANEKRKEVAEEQRQRKRGKRRSDERHARKSLFSSSEEEGAEEEEEEKEKAFNISTKPSLPVLENRRQKLANGPDSSLGRSLSQRPLSVQSFGSSVGDGTTNISDDRKTTVSGQAPSLVRKTESAITVSVVSNNEEFGPTSIKNRIAQIGGQIPVGRRTTDGTRREQQNEQRQNGGNEQRTAHTEGTCHTMAPLPTEAIKTRAKAPSARRAPSQRIINGKPPMPSFPSSSSPLEAIKETQQQQNDERKRPVSRGTDETQKQQQSTSEKPLLAPSLPTEKAQGSSAGPQAAARTTPAKTMPPPPVKPKKTTRSSIFSSSSSDDDLGFSKVIGTAKAKVPPPLPQPNKAKEVPKTKAKAPSEQQPPPFNYKKTTAPSKTRKGLFDDTDSDF
ncbi:hypothetical protein niasHS_006566 [Heterodera schachtii]|uniref:Uncharacterized protein n=1 Tax=Heterodera schachtii TaxID=97005 RepID=A0ABD2JHX6_HETSC